MRDQVGEHVIVETEGDMAKYNGVSPMIRKCRGVGEESLRQFNSDNLLANYTFQLFCSSSHINFTRLITTRTKRAASRRFLRCLRNLICV